MTNLFHRRHLAKTVTWRIVGTLDTVLLSWIIAGNPFTGLKIGISEVITKMVLYYFHERVWFNIGIRDSKKRHLIKTVTWRIIGTMDTVLLAWIITGSSLVGFKIGLAEVISKMALYYAHERVWYRLNYGLGKRKRANKWKGI